MPPSDANKAKHKRVMDNPTNPNDTDLGPPQLRIKTVQVPIEATCSGTMTNSVGMDIDQIFNEGPPLLPLPLLPSLENGSPSPPPTPTHSPPTPEVPDQNRVVAFFNNVSHLPQGHVTALPAGSVLQSDHHVRSSWGSQGLGISDKIMKMDFREGSFPKGKSVT